MRARDVAFIRKLCTLGLAPRALVLSLLPALRELVPAHSGGVFWVDAAGQMTSLYAERLLPPDAMAAYYERHYESGRQGFAQAFRARCESADPVSMHSFTKEEQAGDYFRDVLMPLDAYHVLYGVLAQGREPFGQISLYRGATSKPFSVDDASVLRGLIRYLSAGLAEQQSSSRESEESVVVEEQLGVVTSTGAVVSGSTQWQRLVRLAAVARLTPREAHGEQGAIERYLLELCEAAREAVAGTQSSGMKRQTAWGRFIVRVFPLDDVRGRRARQLGVLIRREEPQSLSLVRGVGRSDLSPQQREVALMLSQGKTNPEIAEEMGLTLNTVSYHVKEVFGRLGVTTRADVQARLLALAHAGVAGTA
jgi:DNA-binding CsgD family transcriptional regulator